MRRDPPARCYGGSSACGPPPRAGWTARRLLAARGARRAGDHGASGGDVRALCEPAHPRLGQGSAHGRARRHADRAGNDRIARDLLSVVPMTLTRGDQTSMIFRGGPGYVVFATATGFGPGRGGIELVSFGIEQDGAAGQAIVRRRAPLRDAALTASGFRDPVTLLTGPYQYRFDYVAADGTKVAEWQDRRDMPARVRADDPDADRPAAAAAALLLRAGRPLRRLHHRRAARLLRRGRRRGGSGRQRRSRWAGGIAGP